MPLFCWSPNKNGWPINKQKTFFFFLRQIQVFWLLTWKKCPWCKPQRKFHCCKRHKKKPWGKPGCWEWMRSVPSLTRKCKKRWLNSDSNSHRRWGADGFAGEWMKKWTLGFMEQSWLPSLCQPLHGTCTFFTNGPSTGPKARYEFEHSNIFSDFLVSVRWISADTWHEYQHSRSRPQIVSNHV